MEASNCPNGASSCPDGYCYSLYDIWSDDFHSGVADTTRCAELCQATEGCVVFEYDPSERNCGVNARGFPAGDSAPPGQDPGTYGPPWIGGGILQGASQPGFVACYPERSTAGAATTTATLASPTTTTAAAATTATATTTAAAVTAALATTTTTTVAAVAAAAGSEDPGAATAAEAAAPGVGQACSALPSECARYDVSACAGVAAGRRCDVTCNSKAGWHGTSARFVCPPGNSDPRQVPVPDAGEPTWPSCSGGDAEEVVRTPYWLVCYSIAATLFACILFLCLLWCARRHGGAVAPAEPASPGAAQVHGRKADVSAGGGHSPSAREAASAAAAPPSPLSGSVSALEEGRRRGAEARHPPGPAQRRGDVEAARREVQSFMSGKTVHFDSANDARLPGVEQAWAIDVMLDEHERASNLAVLDGVASIMRRYPHLELECRGETGSPDPGHCLAIGRYYDLDPHDGAQFKQLMDHLARNRALACKTALAERGIDESRMDITYDGGSGRMEVTFIPQLGRASEQSTRDGADQRAHRAGEAASGPLPEGWRSAVDQRTGRVYYYHRKLRLRQWRRPEPDDADHAGRSSGRGLSKHKVANRAGEGGEVAPVATLIYDRVMHG